MVAQFGAVQEITYSGIHVEVFFPADEKTEAYFNRYIDWLAFLIPYWLSDFCTAAKPLRDAHGSVSTTDFL